MGAPLRGFAAALAAAVSVTFLVCTSILFLKYRPYPFMTGNFQELSESNVCHVHVY